MSALYAVVMLFGGVGLVLAIVGQFRAGTAFQRYKNWQGLWVSYGEILVFVGVVWSVLLVGGVWAWIARRREESSFLKKYRKNNGAA
jgi:predicted small integral membrane protein